MKETTMLEFRHFKNSIKNKLSKEELDSFNYLLDSLTYDKLDDEENLHFGWLTYDVILVDGSEFLNLKYNFDINGFMYNKKLNHPSAKIYEDNWYISRELVKYYRISI
jgi:hypothetical protein